MGGEVNDHIHGEAVKPYRLELHEAPNPGCIKCHRALRNDMTDSGLCEGVSSTEDQFPLRCVGDWAYDKIYRLVQYFGIFTAGMKNVWRGLNYIEVCSGPGRCIRKSDGIEMDGTSLAIVRHPIFKHINRALFVDINPQVVDVLNARLRLHGAHDRALAVVGDYHDSAGFARILQVLPAKCLNLCFVDPTECDVPFATMEAMILQLQRLDILVNVALGTDVIRNMVAACLDPAFAKARDKYEAFLGNRGFCSSPAVVAAAQTGDMGELKRLFLEAYAAAFARYGFQYSDARPVKHYYHLLFLSRDPRGLDFWSKACRIAPDNQRELF